jgi:trk system potassium uptake protein TrkA
MAPGAKTVVRVHNIEYVDAWRERQLDFDHVVSPEEEAAHAISRAIGLPAARQTDVFADGQVVIAELDVQAGPDSSDVLGLSLREARMPEDSRIAGIVRHGEHILPGGDEMIHPGDRVVVIASPSAARSWSAMMAHEDKPVNDVVIYGAGGTGVASARLLLEQGIRIRLVEPDPDHAREADEALTAARVFHSDGFDPDFLERERVGDCEAAIAATADDFRNLYAATLLKDQGVGMTIAVVRQRHSSPIFSRAGVDVTVDPRSVTAEEIVRFAYDPRTRQVAMLEEDRFEVLDITVRPDSSLVNTKFRDLPMTGSLIGAIVRDGAAIFPHGDDMLLPGDRAIIFTDAARASEVERAL